MLDMLDLKNIMILFVHFEKFEVSGNVVEHSLGCYTVSSKSKLK